MRSKLPIAVLCGALLMALAACGGGGDGARITELEADLVAEQEARGQAEEKAEEAELKRQEEEEARAEAEAEATEAEREAAEADREAADAEAAAAEAERLRLEEEAARLAAEAEAQRLEAAAEERRKADATEDARVAIDGHVNRGAPGTLMVGSIKHGEPVPVTMPAPPFTTTTSGSGRWSITGHTDRREATRHTVEIYTDVEAPKSSAFRTSRHNTQHVGGSGSPAPTVVIDGTGDVVGWVNVMNASGGNDNHSRIVASGAFPVNRGPNSGSVQPYSLVDRGITEAQYDVLDSNGDEILNEMDGNFSAPVTDAELALVNVEGVTGITRQQYNQYRAGNFRDESDFPERYAYTTSGTLQGAGGTYRCSGDMATDTCTVQNRGGSFEFGGDWAFIPSSGTVQIVTEDAQYMWFGWWAEQTVEHTETPDGEHTTDIWKFEANHGGNRVTNLDDATGSATYTGPAAGRYAVYEPDTGDSGIGSFTASATLQADFDSSPNTVSGSITGFSNDPSWSLALKQKNIPAGTGATAAIAQGEDSVTWTIDGIPDDSGAWEATFYSNLPLVDDQGDPATAVDYQPHGIAGTFEATYDPSGVGARAAVIGGFGAHKQ